jgi:hypothetical protein
MNRGVVSGAAAAWLITAAPAATQTFPTEVDAGCRQGVCTRIEFLSREEEARTPGGALYRVRFRQGRIAGSRVVWRQPEEAYAHCSINRPAYIFRAPGARGWTAHLLAPGYAEALAGYNTDSHRAYSIVCHGVAEIDGPMARAVRNSQGYPARLAREVGQVELTEPRQILEAR